LDGALQERAELEEEIDRHADDLEKSTQVESDAGRTCGEIAKSLRNLISICRQSDREASAEDADCPELSIELPSSLQTVHEYVRAVADLCAETVSERRQLTSASQTARQTVSELETQIRVLEAEKNATDQRNARYDQERIELGSAIAKLRTGLAAVKARLVAAEEEKKRLRDENAQLRAAIAPLKP
jgi:chromosome segregation ATPase